MRQFTAEHPEIDKEWFVNSNYLGLLSAKDETALVELIRQAEDNNIQFLESQISIMQSLPSR